MIATPMPEPSTPSRERTHVAPVAMPVRSKVPWTGRSRLTAEIRGFSASASSAASGISATWLRSIGSRRSGRPLTARINASAGEPSTVWTMTLDVPTRRASCPKV